MADDADGAADSAADHHAGAKDAGAAAAADGERGRQHLAQRHQQEEAYAAPPHDAAVEGLLQDAITAAKHRQRPVVARDAPSAERDAAGQQAADPR